MSKGLKGFQKGHPPLVDMRGRKVPEEVKKKISLTLQGTKMPWISRSNREKPRNLKDGHTKVKLIALIRDDYTCQICGLRDPEIVEVDHIIPRAKSPELIHSIDNLMTLCPNCHVRKSKRDRKFYKFYRS